MNGQKQNCKIKFQWIKITMFIFFRFVASIINFPAANESFDLIDD